MQNAQCKNWKWEAGSGKWEADGAARRPQSSARSTQHCRIRGFTLAEMVVAVALLVILILAVGQVFKNASAAISLAQASSEVVSNVRGAQLQIEQDMAGLDRNGFLEITATNQVLFTTMGSFTNYTNASSYSFFPCTPANEAIIQYGPASPNLLTRQSTALCTPGQIYGSLSSSETPLTITPPTSVASATDCFKMMPVMLQGVSNFAVAWTDGTSSGGQLNWYSTAQIFSQGGTYPKALKFTYQVTDTKNVLQGGRTFVHIVKVPD